MRKFIVVGGFLVLTSFCLGGPAYSAPKAASRGAALTMSVTQEASEEVRIADIVVSFQTPAGGWSKNLDLSVHPRVLGEAFAPDNRSQAPGTADFDAPQEAVASAG